MELPGFLTTPDDPSANGWRALLPDCTLPADELLLLLEAVPDGVRLVLVFGVSALWVAVVLWSEPVLEGWVVVVVVPRLRVAVTLWELLFEDDDEAGFVVVVVIDAVVAVIPSSPIIVVGVVRRQGVYPVAVIVASVVKEPSRTAVVDWRTVVWRYPVVAAVLVVVGSDRTLVGVILRRRSIASRNVLRLCGCTAGISHYA